MTLGELMKCEQCVQEGVEPHRVPFDNHGIAIMQAHFQQKHGIALNDKLQPLSQGIGLLRKGDVG